MNVPLSTTIKTLFMFPIVYLCFRWPASFHKPQPGIAIRGLSKKYPTFGGEKYISYVTGLGP